MFYSHSIDNEKFGLFVLFLNHILKGDKKFEAPVNSVLIETRALAMGEKDVYSINRDTFSIVVYLNKCDRDFFGNLPNTQSFEPKVYDHVFDLLNKQRPISIV